MIRNELELLEMTGYDRGTAEYRGMEAADIRLSQELEGEKRLLKQMYAELSLENWILKEVLEKKTLEPVVKRQLVCRLRSSSR